MRLLPMHPPWRALTYTALLFIALAIAWVLARGQ